MKELTELIIQVRHLSCVFLEEGAQGIRRPSIMTVVFVHKAVTDRLLVSDEAVRVMGVGR